MRLEHGLFLQPLSMAGGSQSRDRHSSLSTSQSAGDNRPETAIVSAACRGSKDEEEEKIPPWSLRRLKFIQHSTVVAVAGPNRWRIPQLRQTACSPDGCLFSVYFHVAKWPGHCTCTTLETMSSATTQLAPKRVCNGAWRCAAAARAPIGWWAKAAAKCH
jgi:hypothetical protein